jgi:hypothetical protein
MDLCEIPSDYRQTLWNLNCTLLLRQKFRTSTWAPYQPAREGLRNAGLTVIHGWASRTIGFSNAVGWNIVCRVHHSPLPLLYSAFLRPS